MRKLGPILLMSWPRLVEGGERGDMFFPESTLLTPQLLLLSITVLVVSACLYIFFPPSDVNGKLAESSAAVQAALNFLSIVLFLICALMYNSSYYNHRASSKSKLYFWAELMNALPSIGYTGTAGVQLFSALAIGPTTPAKSHRQMLSTLAAINLIFDGMYCIDALLCAGGWYSETLSTRREHVTGEVLRSKSSSFSFISLFADRTTESGFLSPRSGGEIAFLLADDKDSIN